MNEDHLMDATPNITPFEAKMLVGGKMVASKSGETIRSVSPMSEAEIGSAPAASQEDVAAAVEAAEAAAVEWSALDLDKRCDYLRRLASAIRDRKSEIAELETRDTGALHRAMVMDAERSAEHIEFYAGLGHAVLGTTHPASANHLHLVVREPFGVVGRIVAFNHPFYFAAGRLAAPLVTGNTIVIKSPDQAPLSGSILGEICRDTLPPGVVNVISGTGASAGDALVRHPAVKRLAFIGSVGVAQRIQQSAAETAVKNVTLELGGKNMMVVLPGADPERTAALAVEGMNFQWQGQSCGSTSLLCLHDSIHDEVLRHIVRHVGTIKVGDPFDPATGMGPVISAAHYDKVMSAIRQGRSDGAKVEIGGERPAGSQFDKGYWIEPTVFSGVTPDQWLARNEIFGPVLAVLRWTDLSTIEAIDRRSPLGLTASIIGQDIDQALSLARKLRVGYVWVNSVRRHFMGMPFGGMKNSGLGREESIDELLSYTEQKTINIAIRH
jgi:betaine-aldehyde dehydrogenase